MPLDQRNSALKNVWWIERDQIGIARKSETDSSVSYVSPTEVKEIRVHFVKDDEDFIAADTGTGIGMTEEPSIPKEFHDALTYYCISKGYELKPELINSAVYFRKMWAAANGEGKRVGNIAKDGTGYHISQYDF